MIKKDAEYYFNQGNLKASLKQYEEAIEDFDEAIKLDPEYADAYNNRGNLKASLKQYEEAIEDFNKAIKLDPEYEYYFKRGNLKDSLKQYEEAIEDFDEAIKLDPECAEAYNDRGKSKFGLKQYKEAIEDFNKAIKLDPEYAGAYNNRGNLKAILKQYKEAIEDFNKAIKLDPKYAVTYYNRGNLKANLKRYKEAIKDFNKAIKLDPEYAEAYNNRGNSKVNLKEFKEAIEDYDEAIRLSNDGDEVNTRAKTNKGIAEQLLESKKSIKEQKEIRAGINEIKELIKPYKTEKNKTFLFGLIKKSTLLAIAISSIVIAIVGSEYYFVFKGEITGFRMMAMSISAFSISSPIVWIFVKMVQKEKDLDTILLHLEEKKFLISWVNPKKPKELKQLQKYFMQNKASDLLTNNKTDCTLPILNMVSDIAKASKGK